ncbi:MAG: hypothetical protein WC477_03365 [Patescibacteria group bacterium]
MNKSPINFTRDPHRMPSRPSMSAPPLPKGAKPVHLPDVSMMEQRLRADRKKTTFGEIFTVVILIAFIICFVIYLAARFEVLPPQTILMIERVIGMKIK